MAEEIITLLYLWINAKNDAQKKQVMLWTVLCYSAAGILLSVLGKRGIGEIMAALLLGGFMCGISFVSKGAMGFGDALVIMSLGTVWKMEQIMVIFGLALLAAMIFSAILLITKKANRKTEIAFIPFLLLGYVGGLCIW